MNPIHSAPEHSLCFGECSYQQCLLVAMHKGRTTSTSTLFSLTNPCQRAKQSPVYSVILVTNVVTFVVFSVTTSVRFRFRISFSNWKKYTVYYFSILQLVNLEELVVVFHLMTELRSLYFLWKCHSSKL